MIPVDLPSVRCQTSICHAPAFTQGWVSAESRIAAALACHTVDIPLTVHDIIERRRCTECNHVWDTEADRCTSPTVTALLGGGG